MKRAASTCGSFITLPGNDCFYSSTAPVKNLYVRKVSSPAKACASKLTHRLSFLHFDSSDKVLRYLLLMNRNEDFWSSTFLGVVSAR